MISLPQFEQSLYLSMTAVRGMTTTIRLTSSAYELITLVSYKMQDLIINEDALSILRRSLDA